MKREKSAVEMEQERQQQRANKRKREDRKALIFGLLAILLVAGGSIFAYQKYLSWKDGGTTPTTTVTNNNNAINNSSNTANNSNNTAQNTAGNAANNSGSSSSSNSTSSIVEKPFNYSPPAVRNGKKAGIIEVGASGFNSFAINTNGKDWEMVKKRFDKSFVADGLAKGQRIEQVLGDYISVLTEQDGVSGRNIHFVVSSGAQKEPETQPIINALKKQGYFVNTVTPQQEGQYAFKSLVPESFRKNSFSVDIGSGNTKISWMDDKGKIQAVETVGAKYYQKDIDDKAAYKQALNAAAKVPTNRLKNCFIIGGFPYSLTQQHSTKSRYTSLVAPDKYKLEGAKSKSGGNIYKAIRAATDCQEFIFDADANFSIGLLNEIIGKKK